MVTGAGETTERESNVAWFKLAELISRGEKEKALNLYRLLSHSFDNRGYVLQVEGDILWSFEDAAAVDKYQQAAFLYKKDQKVTAAVGIYEHLLTLYPKRVEYVIQLIEFYIRLDWPDQVKDRCKRLLELYHESELSEVRLIDAIGSFLRIFQEVKGNDKKSICSFKMILEILKKEAPNLASKVKSL